jgi:hypothetical protein
MTNTQYTSVYLTHTRIAPTLNTTSSTTEWLDQMHEQNLLPYMF